MAEQATPNEIDSIEKAIARIAAGGLKNATTVYPVQEMVSVTNGKDAAPAPPDGVPEVGMEIARQIGDYAQTLADYIEEAAEQHLNTAQQHVTLSKQFAEAIRRSARIEAQRNMEWTARAALTAQTLDNMQDQIKLQTPPAEEKSEKQE